MQPHAGAVEAVLRLCKTYEVYVLSTAPWLNASAWSDKLDWVQRHFGVEEGSPLYKRLILSHHKNLNKGDILIDDRLKNGVVGFCGEHIHFGTEACPDWSAMLAPSSQTLRWLLFDEVGEVWVGFDTVYLVANEG